MIDLETEEPLKLREAARLPFLKRHGRVPHLATLYRWATAGVRGVRLETVQIGGSRCTTRAALLRFLDRLTNPRAEPGRRTPSQRQRAITQAEKELADAGM